MLPAMWVIVPRKGLLDVSPMWPRGHVFLTRGEARRACGKLGRVVKYVVARPRPRREGGEMVTVTREKFMRDAGAVMRRSETEGPIGILNDRGEVGAVVHAPIDNRPDDADYEALRSALARVTEERDIAVEQAREYAADCIAAIAERDEARAANQAHAAALNLAESDLANILARAERAEAALRQSVAALADLRQYPTRETYQSADAALGVARAALSCRCGGPPHATWCTVDAGKDKAT